jgi:nucleotide-binding universal stress UspA family protein
MFQHIMYPTDGSAASLRAASAVTRLTSPQSRLNVTIVVVVSPLTAEQTDCQADFLERHNAWLRGEAQLIADRAVERFRASGVVCTTKVLEGRPVSAVLAKEASSGKYELVVMSSRGMGHKEDTLRYVGRVTEHMIRRVSIPVLVVPVEDEDDDG